jgi:hypothetical protein
MSGQYRRFDPGQRLNYAVQGPNIKAQEEVTARAASSCPARRLGRADREMDRSQIGGQAHRAFAVVLIPQPHLESAIERRCSTRISCVQDQGSQFTHENDCASARSCRRASSASLKRGKAGNSARRSGRPQ